MSHKDVPGHNPDNDDELAMGCWGEHPDGSLILVESVEDGSVVYSMFDLSKDPPVEYRDAMEEDGFKDRFSFPTPDDIVWEWHDKTAFPWKKVMKEFPAGPKSPSALTQMSAAQRVAISLNIDAQKLRPLQKTKKGRKIMKRMLKALGKLDK